MAQGPRILRALSWGQSRVLRTVGVCVRGGCRQTRGKGGLGSPGDMESRRLRITVRFGPSFAALALAIHCVNPLESSSLPRSQGATWLGENRGWSQQTELQTPPRTPSSLSWPQAPPGPRLDVGLPLAHP